MHPFEQKSDPLPIYKDESRLQEGDLAPAHANPEEPAIATDKAQLEDRNDVAPTNESSDLKDAILFEITTHKKPTLNDIYLIHQQGWQGAAEHVSHSDRLAWKSMCATDEGRAKGEKWCTSSNQTHLEDS